MADSLPTSNVPAPEPPKPKLDLKKWAKRVAIPVVGVVVGGLYQQGYISEEVYKTALRLVLSLVGLG